jgi:thiamine biosynthesis lipoprotein
MTKPTNKSKPTKPNHPLNQAVLGLHAASIQACACILLLATTAALQPALAEKPTSLIRYEATAPIMGCTFGVAAYGTGRATLARQVESAFDEARQIESWLSNYQPESELSRLNRTAAEAPVPVSSKLFALLTKAREYSRGSNGAFDMTVGPLVRAWGFHEGNGRLPDAAALDHARNRTGFQLVRLNPTNKTVVFARNGVELDPGGIGKGYAVDRMVEVLRNAGVKSALVNACHSSIYALGAPPENPKGWALEIEHPTNSGTVEEVLLKDQSLSTSGSTERFFEASGHRYSHILDPRTGQPAEGLLAVTVVAPNALDSEVWSTALFVNGIAWASRHAPKALDIHACPAGDGCRWIRGR